MPDSASYITHSLMKDGVPSENSEVGINFVFGSKVKSKSWFIPTQMNFHEKHESMMWMLHRGSGVYDRSFWYHRGRICTSCWHVDSCTAKDKKRHPDCGPCLLAEWRSLRCVKKVSRWYCETWMRNTTSRFCCRLKQACFVSTKIGSDAFLHLFNSLITVLLKWESDIQLRIVWIIQPRPNHALWWYLEVGR